MKTKILGLLAAGLLAGPMTAGAVVVGNLEWRQATETVGFTWNAIQSVCNINNGACQGSLGLVSFDGWTWAASSDIQALFEALIHPGSTQFPTAAANFSEADSADIAAAIGAASFLPTYADADLRLVLAMSRSVFVDQTGASYPISPFLTDFARTTSSSTNDQAFLGVYYTTPNEPSNVLGVWLYRPVPEPGTLVLLGLGLAGLGLGRRRHDR